VSAGWVVRSQILDAGRIRTRRRHRDRVEIDVIIDIESGLAAEDLADGEVKVQETTMAVYVGAGWQRRRQADTPGRSALHQSSRLRTSKEPIR
jgi:hypothetical protein